MNSTTATQVLDLLKTNPPTLLDVRSEGEFAQGALPHSVNRPILDNDHRHQVGLCYKTHGPEKAIELGHHLVGPLKAQRVESWRDHRYLFCWRGGLRSKIAQQWLQDSGVSALRIEGGYKALRRELLSALETATPFLVLSGPTGAGKTRLLRQLDPTKGIDLEALAHHRGSAFGRQPGGQPTQATFENHLGLALWRAEGPVLVEDESRLIGRLRLPETIYQQMALAPRVLIETPVVERAENIFNEYIATPLAKGTPRDELHSFFLQGIERLRRKLGGALHLELQNRISSAFQNDDPAAHSAWIAQLLTSYYDKTYQYALQLKTGPIVFRGGFSECLEYLRGSHS